MTGSRIIPGAAMVTRDITTCEIPIVAHFLDFSRGFPFSSEISMPLMISDCRERGMLTAFAAATATNGTHLAKIGLKRVADL